MKTALVILLFVVALGIVGRMDMEDAKREQASYSEIYVAEDDMFWDCTTSRSYGCGEPITNWPVPDAIYRR